MAARMRCTGAQALQRARRPAPRDRSPPAPLCCLQAIKRLMTFCQRRYPTDPSRCVDFDGFSNAGEACGGHRCPAVMHFCAAAALLSG